MPELRTDPRFEYEDIAPPQLPVAKLDLMMESLLDPEPLKKLGWFGLIFTGLKIACVLAWLIARDRLIKAQQEYKKQVYDRTRPAQNRTEIDADDLASERRP